MALPRPYQCPNCLNWHTPLPKEPEDACVYCLEGTHAAHPKTGVVDCHFMEVTTTSSERQLQETVNWLREKVALVGGLPDAIATAGSQAGVTAALTRAEEALAEAERIQGQVDKHLEWAGVKEMPGLRGERPDRRFKGLPALYELVEQKRRPQSDIDRAEYSVKVCKDIASEIPGLMADIRIGVNLTRKAAESWVAPSAAPEKAKPRRRAKAPAAV